MILRHSKNHGFYFEPEDDREAEELDEFEEEICYKPVTFLEQMLLDETTNWKSILLAEQILDDLVNYWHEEK
ncbi:MAG: hypothetical protein ACP5D6_06345 [Kosmotogaceae bacterium]